MGNTRTTEYAVHRGESLEEADVDHVTWRQARQLVANPDADILLIERVTRWWHDDGACIDEQDETLYERL